MNERLSSTMTSAEKGKLPFPVEMADKYKKKKEDLYFPEKQSEVFRENSKIIFLVNVVIISFFLFFFSIDFISISDYKKNNKELLETVSEQTLSILSEKVSDSEDFSALNELRSDYMENYAKLQNMQFYLCNSAGGCAIATSGYQGKLTDIFLSAKQQEAVKKSNTFDPSVAGISTKSYSLCRGEYFTVQVKNLTEDYYLLTVYTNENYHNFYLKIIISSVILFLLFSGAAIVGIYFYHRDYTRYFNGFSKVVQNFAKDDFSHKLTVPSYTKSDYFVEMLEATNQLAVNIETSEERRKQFISNVSHELRTPMTSICGFVDGMLDGTIPPSEHKKYLTIVSQETRRLKNMIQSMLNLTRIESGTLNLPKAEFNITDTVVRTLLLFENSIDQKHLEVECKAEEPYKINGNADYIQQVIYNIIENAVKFINEGGQLTVTVAADPDDDYYVNVSVRNTGEGLSTDEIPRIFERFYKTDQSRSKDKTGLGLGLTICKRIVHLHDGRILVRSVQGKYTEFVIQLPQIKKNRQTDRKHSEEN